MRDGTALPKNRCECRQCSWARHSLCAATHSHESRAAAVHFLLPVSHLVLAPPARIPARPRARTPGWAAHRGRASERLPPLALPSLPPLPPHGAFLGPPPHHGPPRPLLARRGDRHGRHAEGGRGALSERADMPPANPPPARARPVCTLPHVFFFFFLSAATAALIFSLSLSLPPLLRRVSSSRGA